MDVFSPGLRGGTLVAIALLGTSVAPPSGHARLDPGGFSVEIAGGELEREQIGPDYFPPEILDGPLSGLPDGWWRSFSVPLPDRDEARYFQDKAAPFAESGVAEDPDGERGRLLRIFSASKIIDLVAGGDRWFRNTLATRAVLPDDADGQSYLFRMDFRGHLAGGARNRLRVQVTFHDSDGALLEPMVQYLYAPTHHWQEAAVELTIPQGARSMGIRLHLDGAGEVFLADPGLYQIARDEGPQVRLMPFDFLDRRFALSHGDPHLALFGFRDPGDVAWTEARLVLELPEEIQVLGVHERARLLAGEVFERDGTSWKRHILEVGSPVRSAGPDGFSARSAAVSILLQTELPEGSTVVPRYWLESDRHSTDPREFQLEVLPSLSAPQPERFTIGGMFTAGDGGLASGEGAAAYADFYKRTGMGHVHSRLGGLSEAFGDAGIYRWHEPGRFLANGYRIGPGRKPDHAAFELVDGSLSHDGICPVEVYERGSYYRETFLPLVRDLIVQKRQTEGLMSNWEPYMYYFRGCFCERCKTAFRDQTGLSAERVEEIWPSEVIRTYRDDWIDFRAWQHGRLVATLAEDIAAIGAEAGVESAFVPMAAVPLFTEEWEESPRWRQIAANQWWDDVEAVSVWGPYIYHRFFTGPYRYYGTGRFAGVANAAQQVNAYTREQIGSERPTLFAFPVGYMGDDFVTFPEAIAFDLLLYFLNQWDGAVIYAFPKGYDARYWAALAEAIRTVAAFESLVFDGERLHEAKVEVKSALPEWHRDLVRVYEYHLNGKRLLAVANFWENGEVYYRLKLDGLDPERSYTLHEPLKDRVYGGADPEQPLVTGRDLSEGVLLQTGALRVRFFVLEEASDEATPAGVILTAPDMQRFFNETRERLVAAAEAEDLLNQTPLAEPRAHETLFDGTEEIEREHGRVRVEQASGIDEKRLVVETSTQEIAIDPLRGGRITRWKVKGTELAAESDTFGIGIPGLWLPQPTLFLEPFSIDKTELDEDRAVIRFSYQVPSDANLLAGLVIEKKIVLKMKELALKVEHRLINHSGGQLEFAFRLHNLFRFFELSASGVASMTGEAGEEVFTREYLHRAYRFGAGGGALEDRLRRSRMAGLQPIREATLRLAEENAPVSIMLAPEPEAEFYGYIFWDSGSMQFSTVEPSFEKIQLMPGESWTAALKLRIIE